MKPAPPDRSIPKLRPLRSLYIQNTTSGRRETISSKLPTRKTVFKPTPKNARLTSNLSMKAFPMRVQTGINRKSSMRVSRMVNSVPGKQQCPQTNGVFLRPSVDVRSFHQQFMDRAKRIGEMLKTDGNDSLVINRINLKSPTVPRTPKATGLSRAYIKLSEFKSRSPATRKTVQSSPASPFEARIDRKKTNLDITKVTNVNPEKCSKVSNKSDSVSSTNVKFKIKEDKENQVPKIIVSNDKPLSKDVSLNPENAANENSRHCALDDILQASHHYRSNMSNLNKVMDGLDQSLRSAMVGELDGKVREKFMEHQKRKRELYKKMELLEEELEKIVMNELDVESKFKEYLERKSELLKERGNVQENFEKLVMQTIRNYENEIVKPAKNDNFEEIVNSLIRSREDEEVVKPVLRRSKRLLGTPKIVGDSGSKKGKRRSAKKVEDADESIVKRGRNANDKKWIQSCIYKDLQKSFNLCSPDCSF